ncbi:MAG: hypothetical protein HYS25_15325 [Ignavibacteriales bacterium]|nr:hypothetical protein [Ignavibacteriales bacterium]
MYKKGDILLGEKTNHPIIYLNKEDDYYFNGCIITHSPTSSYKNNISFLPEHFEMHDEDDNPYRIIYDNSHFVNLKLIKKTEWGPFNKVGKLSRIGIQYLEKYLEKDDSTEWRAYISKNK